MSRRILILHTGGTLGMRPRHPDQALAPDEFGKTVLEHVPELRRLAQIDTKVLCNVDSTDLTPDHWIELARAVHAAHGRYAGVVITHGTDAMAHTAAALSYALRGLPFPVILTGSQRPLSDVHSDGRANLIGAVDLALRPIPEVTIYFDGLLLRGNRATKATTFAFGAFRSPNHLPLAEIGTEVRLIGEPLRPSGTFRVEGAFDRRVGVIWLVPGDDGSSLQALAGRELGAVLVCAFGMGNIPIIDPAVGRGVQALVDRGTVVAIGSQSRGGSVQLSRYSGGRRARELGAVGIGDMTIEAATVKLMYLLGTLGSPQSVRDALLVPIAGELSG